MYSSKVSMMFLGLKKQKFSDTTMWRVDFYVDGENDSFFVNDNNPIVGSLQKIKPTTMCVVEIAWFKSRDQWKHRLVSLKEGIQ